jgi:hypothetical protein
VRGETVDTESYLLDLCRKQVGVACEFVKYPTLRVGGVSEGSVSPGFVGGAGPGVVAGEVDVFPTERLTLEINL